jgi:hypothetical protein
MSFHNFQWCDVFALVVKLPIAILVLSLKSISSTQRKKVI